MLDEEIILEQNAGFDVPDYQDRTFEDFFGLVGAGEEQEKVVFPFERLQVIDQGANRDTRAACTQCAPLNINNGQNILEYKKKDIDYIEVDILGIWRNYNKNRGANARKGDSIQSGLNNIKKLGFISGYVKINTIEEMKKCIDMGKFISTGSSNGDWKKVRLKKEYGTVSNFIGHAFAIVGYDDKKMIGLNSYGNENGYFDIDWSFFNKLYSKYAILDASDEQKIKEYKQKNEFELLVRKMKALGITNGENLKDNITREQAIVMIARLHNLLQK